MVQVGAQPNVRADQHAIAEGMAVEWINRLGPLDHDLYAGIGLFSRLLPVGFTTRHSTGRAGCGSTCSSGPSA